MASSSVQLDTVPMGMCSESWVLRDGGTVYHNGEEVAKAKEVPQEGDIVVSEVEGTRVSSLSIESCDKSLAMPSSHQQFPCAQTIQGTCVACPE